MSDSDFLNLTCFGIKFRSPVGEDSRPQVMLRMDMGVPRKTKAAGY